MVVAIHLNVHRSEAFMRPSTQRLLAVSLTLLLVPAVAWSDDPPTAPSYAKQVKPFLAKYCVECHNHDDADGGFVVETHELLGKGGERGVTIVAGKPDESRLVLQLEGKAKPKMPPKAANQPKPEEIALVRAWVAAGAKDDSAAAGAAGAKVALPVIKPRGNVAPRVTAMAFTPDGKIFVAAAYRDLMLVNPVEGTYYAKTAIAADPITAVALSRDGKRLAVATGASGQHAEIHIVAMPAQPAPVELKPERSFRAHADMIHAIDFSPDGKLLATCGYDKLVKLWSVDTGTEAATFKDHSDAVYGVSFSRDGKLLASCAADRAVKVWDVATGKRLYTLSEPTDWVYAVAWSPDGRLLAAAGVDKSIRVWEANAASGKIVHSTFAHDAAITRLVYSADSKTLFSLSEDRTVKAWDAAQMIERHHTDKLPETPLALAVSADGRQLAVGRYDGIVDFFDAASGKKLREPLAVATSKPAPKPEPPVLASIAPRGAERGKTVRLVLDGKHLAAANEFVVTGTPTAGAIVAKLVQDDETAMNPNRARADVTIPADAVPGVVRVSVKSPGGQTAELPFAITPFPEIAETGANEAQATAPKITLPATVVGALDRAGDTDYFRFDAAAGQQLGVEVVASAIGSKLEPVLTLTDSSSRVLAETTGTLLGHTIEQAGTYVLRVRDADYRGSGEMFYRLNVGPVPIITDVFPLGVARGVEVDVEVRGVNLGVVRSVKIKAAENAAADSRVDVPVKLPTPPAGAQSAPYGAPLNSKNLVVGEFAEVIESAANDDVAGANAVPTPATANGRIERPGDVDVFRFTAKKGQRLIIDVNARRIGSLLDSFVEILDGTGKPLPRATLRSTAKTYTVFRDHESAAPGIRIEDWREFAVNDHVMIGNQLLRILALPKNPDDDCQFFQLRGQRIGFLDTTPAAVSVGTPMYKVSLHPPGTNFPPNGMPLITIPFANDDGGPQYGKDSRLFFDPPADGEYLARISDVRGQGSSSHAYRLAIRPPKPSFTANFDSKSPAVWKGGAVPIGITCERFDGFEGAIDVKLDNLPPGFSAPATTIPPGENATSLAFFAAPDAAAPPADAPKLKLVASANIDGQPLLREVAGSLPSVVEPGDIVTTVEQTEVTIQPGREAKLTVRVERRNDFKGRIPIEVRGLPHGTRVLDIGLNGILITERETSRVITLYSEPWAQATDHPFVVLAKREGKNTEHAASSILLRVVPAATVATAPGSAAAPSK
jgi:mono/diheme cytochrome c family protein